MKDKSVNIDKKTLKRWAEWLDLVMVDPEEFFGHLSDVHGEIRELVEDEEDKE